MPGEIVRLTETSNAEALVYMYGDDTIYCNELLSWLIWDGRRWVEDTSDHMFQFAKEVARSYLQRADALGKNDLNRNRYIRWAAHSESLRGLKAMIEIAKSEDDMSVGFKVFDHNPMLLNVLNGTLDLNTMRLRKFDRGDYLTKIAPVAYTRGAKSRVWLNFLKDIIPDSHTRDFIQAAIGYSLTSHMDEDKLFILHGGGCNGKTTFTGTLLNLLGDYSAQASSATFTGKRSIGPSNDVFVLMGRRFVCATETDESHKLNEALVKQMTGGDKLSINPKYRSQMEFYPTWKIWLSTNYEPIITGGDDAIWRRIIKIPFNVKVVKPDRKLKPRLFNSLEERPGILNWALDGLRVWKNGGLKIPKAIADSTKWYRAEQDLIGQFIQERCQLHPELRIAKDRLYSEYMAYCSGINERPKKKIEFGKRLLKCGVSDTRKRESRLWIGIGLGRAISLIPGDMS